MSIDTQQKINPLILIAFVSAIGLLLLPTQAGIVSSLLIHKDGFAAVLTIVFSLGLVVLIEYAGKRYTDSNPTKWRRSKISAITWGIVGINLTMNAVILFRYFSK